MSTIFAHLTGASPLSSSGVQIMQTVSIDILSAQREKYERIHVMLLLLLLSLLLLLLL